MPKIIDESYVTLATNDNYAIGALTLAKSLRNVNTNRLLTILITNDLSQEIQFQLRSVFDNVETVDALDSNDSFNLAMLKRPELGVTFTKLHCWRLVRFTKCVFLDADCLVLNNVDDLFDREEFSAATDVGWPDCFNSGVFVFQPSLQTFANLINFAVEKGSFDGGDQGLLNSYFSDWSTSDSSRRLPFIYNMTTNVSYSYAPAFNQFKENVKIVHFIGAVKPWYSTYNLDNNSVVGTASNNELHHLNAWWSTFIQHVYPFLGDETKQRLSAQIIKKQDQQFNQGQHAQEWSNTNTNQQTASSPVYQTGAVSSGGVIVGSNQHQNLWEHGQIEYTGRDSFSNIQAHLDAQLQKK